MFLKGTIVSAQKLDEDTMEAIVSRFEKHYKDSIDFSVEVDASIGGGVIVRVQDDVYDGSVRGRLLSMRGQILQ